MAADANCGAVYEHKEFGKATDARSAWIKSLRQDDVAWVPRLDVLVRTSKELSKKTRVSIDLSACLAAIAAKGAVLVEGETGASSRDGDSWEGHVLIAMRRAHNTFRSQQNVTASLARAREARAPNGLRARWKTPAMTEERNRARIIWQSAGFTSDEDAMAALPPELSKSSPATVRSILGGRRPARKGQGGRPVGQKSK
jgi:hypothetical protein